MPYAVRVPHLSEKGYISFSSSVSSAPSAVHKKYKLRFIGPNTDFAFKKYSHLPNTNKF